MLSTGERIDYVLVYPLPDFEESTSITDYNILVGKARSVSRHEPGDSPLLTAIKHRLFYQESLTTARKRREHASATRRRESAIAGSTLHRTATRRLGHVENALRRTPLIIEEELGVTHRHVYVKIHAPWQTLTYQAEAAKLMMPLRVCRAAIGSSSPLC